MIFRFSLKKLKQGQSHVLAWLGYKPSQGFFFNK